MTDFAALYIIAGLFVVIISEFFFFQWLLDRESKEKEKLLDANAQLSRALISKNANEYVMTTSIDKVMVDEKEEKSNFPDEMPEENLSDDQWYENMKKSNEKDN